MSVRRRAFRLGIGAALTCLPAAAWAQDFAEALRDAFHHSQAIAAERARLEATRGEVTKAVAGAEPTVSVDGSLTGGSDKVTGGSALQNSLLSSSVPHSSYDIVIDQPVFHSGHTIAAVSGAIASVRARAYKLSSTEQDALLQAAKDYIDYVRDAQDAAKSADSVSLARSILGGAQERAAKGEGTRLDIETAQAAFAEALADQAVSSSRVAGSRMSFVRDVGAAPSGLHLPDLTSAMPANEEEAARDSGDNPDVLSAEYSARSARDDIRVARSQGRPSVDLEAALRGRDGAVFPAERERAQSISLRVHVPLFSGGAVRADVDSKTAVAASEQDNAVQAREQAESDARSYFEQAQLLAVARERYHASVESDAILVEGQLRLMAHNEGMLGDLLDAKRTLVNAQRAENRAEHDWVLALLNLQRARGRMSLESFGAGPPDPDIQVSGAALIRHAISIPFIR